MYSQYINTDSPIHKLPAVFKLYGLLFFILLSLLVHHPVTAAVYLLAAIMLLRISRLPVLKVFRKIRHVLILLVVGLIFNLIFSPLDEAVTIFLRLLAVVLASQVVIMSTTSEDMIDALEFGFKMKSEYVVSIMIAIAFIPILEKTWSEITIAQSARGYDFRESTFPEKLKGLGAILIPLFRYSVKKAEVLGEALTIKGYAAK